MELYSERIEVELPQDQALPAPVVFTWRGQRYEVRETVRRWTDTGFPPGAKRRSWLERRHREYFRLRTEEGAVWEVYLDRAGGRRAWFLSRRWGPEELPDS